MTKNLKNFIVLTVLLGIAFFGLVVRSYMQDTSKHWLLSFGFIAYALIEQRFIYFFADIKPNPSKRKLFGFARESQLFNHRQLDLQKKYWFVASVILAVLGGLYIAFERRWDGYIGGIIIATPLIGGIDYLQNRRTFKGVNKKDLFQ